jgi:hypothetical protein
MGLADGRLDFLAAAQAALESLFPGELEVVDEPSLGTIDCVRSSDVRAEDAARGGFELDEVVSIRVRAELLSSGGLAVDDLVDLDGRRMRVSSTSREPGDPAWMIELMAAE